MIILFNTVIFNTITITPLLTGTDIFGGLELEPNVWVGFAFDSYFLTKHRTSTYILDVFYFFDNKGLKCKKGAMPFSDCPFA